MMPRFSLRTRTAFLRLCSVLLITAGCTLGVASPASAKARTTAPVKAMWGPITHDGQSQFPIYADLGVKLFQLSLDWRMVAPTQPANPTDPADPAYVWPAENDLAVTEAAKYGINLLALVSFSPRWANGDKDGYVPPTNPQSYADFMVAVAKKYPSIKHFMVWGEPIRANNYQLHPTENRNYFNPGSRPKNEKLPSFSADLRRDARGYATLVDATYASLKALSRKNLVIGGNTTTSGDVDPFNWAKWVRLKNGKPPRMDMWGHNPFGTRGPDLKKPQIMVGTADMSDLDVYLPWVKKYQSRAGRNTRIKYFLSEYTAPTDVRSSQFSFYVTRPLQATWLKQAWKITKANKDIYGLGWIGLRDLPVGANGEESRIGLIDNNNVKKPAYATYKSLR